MANPTFPPITRVFQTWGEYLAACEQPRQGHMNASRTTEWAGWNGTATWEDALELARNGWPAGEERVRDMAKRIESAVLPGIKREDWNFDVEGTTFDVARFLEGEPEHWVKLEESELDAPHKHVRVVYNCGVSCGVEQNVVEGRGAAVTALVELLEYAGHRVEVWVTKGTSYVYQGAPMFSCFVRVKAFDQPMEPARLAFALMSAAVPRRLMFALVEQLPVEYTATIRHNYGYPADTDKATVSPDTECLYIGKALLGEVDWSTPTAAVRWIIETLKAQGVGLELAAAGEDE